MKVTTSVLRQHFQVTPFLTFEVISIRYLGTVCLSHRSVVANNRTSHEDVKDNGLLEEQSLDCAFNVSNVIVFVLEID